MAPVERMVDSPIVETNVVEALVYVVNTAEVVTAEVKVEVVEASDELEEVSSPPAPLSSSPPTAPPGGAVDCVALEARMMNLSSVLPWAGALMAPTMPFWQCVPTVCEQ